MIGFVHGSNIELRFIILFELPGLLLLVGMEGYLANMVLEVIYIYVDVLFMSHCQIFQTFRRK